MAGRMARRQPVGQPLRPSLGQGPGKELQGCALMAQIASGAVGASSAIVAGHRQLGSISVMARLRSRRGLLGLLGLLGSRMLRRHPDLRPQAHGQQSKQEPKGDTTHRHKILRAALFGTRHCQAPTDLLSTARKMIRPKTDPTQRRGSVGQALNGQRSKVNGQRSTVSGQRSAADNTASMAGGKCSGAGKCSACQPKALAASTLAWLSSTNQVRCASSPCRSASSL